MPSFALVPLDPFPPPAGPFPSGTQFQDEQVNVGPPEPKYVSFNGPGVQATYDSANGRVNVEVSTGAVEVRDEGVVVLPAVRKINFVGAGVTATAPSGVTDLVNVTIPGGGGGGGGAVALFRATKNTSQSSGSVLLYQTLDTFTGSYGTLSPSDGLFTVPPEDNVYSFSAGVPMYLAGGEPGFGVAIVSWPTSRGQSPPNDSDLEVLAVYQTMHSAFSNARMLYATLTTGPVRITGSSYVAVIAIEVTTSLSSVSFWTSSRYVRVSNNFENPYSPAFFSGVWYEVVGV